MLDVISKICNAETALADNSADRIASLENASARKHRRVGNMILRRAAANRARLGSYLRKAVFA